MPASLDDRVRLLLARGDRQGAAEAAFRGLGPAMQRYVRSALRDEALAADAFSDFAEDLWRGLPEFRGEASVKTWAYRLAWRAILRARDDAWQRRRRPLSAVTAAEIERLRTRTPVVLERRARALDSLRSRLSLADQSLMVLRVDHALSWADIAQIVAEDGQPVAVDALMKRFQRLKDRLAAMAREEGLV